MKKLIAWLLAAQMVLITACSSIGVIPKTPKQGYVYAVTANASVRIATTEALKSRKISVTAAKAVLKGTDAARVLLDESLDIANTDGAAGKVAEAIDLVTKLAETLKSDGVEVPGL
jgi:hypothetical protein